ncbi:hypothetical protein K7432_004045 [Basidiobolus ranarum]|uniref:Uncharacterized protein n=1 Tax=Basidiobolus ranarum TaxID=34480 RepID=A0ABR2W5N0_9FUNG
MVQETPVRFASAGKRLPLPGLNPNSYTYLDSSSDGEGTQLGDDTDSEAPLSRTYISGKSLPKTVSHQAHFSSISPFSSDLEENELVIPRRHSGKTLKNIINLKKKFDFDTFLEEETEEEDEFFEYDYFTNTKELGDMERRSSDISMFNESRKSSLSLNVSLNPTLHISDEISFAYGLDSVSSDSQSPPEDMIYPEADSGFAKEGMVNLSNIPDADMISSLIEQGVGSSSDNEEIEWHTNIIKVDSGEETNRDFSQHTRYSPYGLKQGPLKIYIRSRREKREK